jgi:hypothetical protein
MSGVRAGYECEASRLMAIPGGGNSVDVSTFEIQARLVEHKLSKADFLWVHLLLHYQATRLLDAFGRP